MKIILGLLVLILSLLLHAAVISGVINLTAKQEEPQQLPRAISISMIAPEEPEPDQPPAVQPPEPEPEPEPEIEPEPEPEPEPPEEVPIIEKPKPKPKPKPRPKKVVKQETTPQPPVMSNVPVSDKAPPARSSAPTGPVEPNALSRGDPVYPPRARELRIEGEVDVQFDIDTNGRPQNIVIISAKPANMFERAVKQAVPRWRYEPGKPYYKGYVVHVKFRLKDAK